MVLKEQDLFAREEKQQEWQAQNARLFGEAISLVIRHDDSPERQRIIQEIAADLSRQESIGAITRSQREELLLLLDEYI